MLCGMWSLTFVPQGSSSSHLTLLRLSNCLAFLLLSAVSFFSFFLIANFANAFSLSFLNLVFRISNLLAVRLEVLVSDI